MYFGHKVTQGLEICECSQCFLYYFLEASIYSMYQL